MTSATLDTRQAPAHRDPLTDQIGEWLRQLRVGLQLTLPDAAASCGNVFSARSLRGWERGRQAINIGTLNTILGAYGVSTAWFMGEAALSASRMRMRLSDR